MLSGGVVPIFCSITRFLPFPAVLASRFTALIIDAPAYRSERWRSIFGNGSALSRGQALFINYFWLLNILFLLSGYKISTDTTWWRSSSAELARQAANRAGMLSIANIALMILWAGRNSFVHYLTDWSPSTFVLLHRWLATISILQAAIHSLLRCA